MLLAHLKSSVAPYTNIHTIDAGVIFARIIPGEYGSRVDWRVASVDEV
jgi:hypothetical protein